MLTITLAPTEGEIFPVELHLEHSLVSLSKWESIHKKVFFGRDEKTQAESLSYIECMVLNDSVPKNFLNRLTEEHVGLIGDYIDARHTATTFREDPSSRSNNEVVTSDIVYYWMIEFQIDWSAERWNFSRLMTLIQICGMKRTKPKKMSRAEVAAQQRALNEQRRRDLGTRG